MNCKVCTKKTNYIFDGKILNKYDIKYFHCGDCGFLQTEEPYWLKEAYSESINLSDTGYIRRNLELSKGLATLLVLFFNKNGKYIDYAGGYGMFVRLMRDIGFDFYWDDLYTQNLFAKGFEFVNTGCTIEAITTFESFEHFVNPIKEIEKLLDISDNIIFTTELLANPIPKPKDWWYYGLEHGQHISFYSEKALRFIANKYKLYYYNLNGFHLITKKRLAIYTKYILRLDRFNFYSLFIKKLKSKTWDDHIKMSQE